MERSAGQYPHPYVTAHISSMDSGIRREPTVFNTMYLGSCKSGKPELRNSFLALLSGPSLQVQYENKQLPNSTSGKLPMQDTSPITGSGDGGVSLMPAGGLLPQHQGNNYMANGAELHPVNPSREVSAYSGNFVSIFHDSHQTTNLNRHNQDIVKPDYQHAIRGNETGTNLSSSRRGWLPSSSPSTLGHFNTKNVQASVKVPSDAKSVVSDCSASSVKGHPYVFCLATKGELLLSNTGLLGVLCCCHGLHMSVRKFCEHSGLFAVNPGEAVRLESGETIAQWRRLYFLKSGIRIPDDNSGWEWPERIPATVGLVKCKTTGLSMSKNSDMFQMVDPFVGVARSGQPCKSFGSQNVSQMGQCVLERTLNNVMQQERNSREGSNVFQRNLIGNTQSTLAGSSDMQTRQIIKESPTTGGLAPFKSSLEKGQEDNAYQSISDYINFLTKGGGASISNQNIGNFKCPGTDSDINRSSSSREGFTIDRDAIPSNIELRLGQPSQQSRTLEGSVVPAVPSQQFDAISDCEKSLFQAHFHDSNTRVAGESRQSLCYAPSDTNFRRQNQSQSNLMHLAPGSSNVVDAAKLEQLNVGIAKSSLISMFLSRLNSASQRELQPLVDSNNMINGEPIMHRVPQRESYIAHNSSDFPKNKSDERQGNINVTRLVPLNNMDKDKAPHIADNCSNTTERANPSFHDKHMAGVSPFTGVIGGYRLLNSLNVNENNIPYLCQPSGTLPHPSDVGNLSNQFEKGTCVGGSSRLDHALLRSIHCSNVTDGSHLPMSAVSMGFSSTTSIGRQNMIAPLANREGDANPHIIDENLKLLALRRMLDLSKQAHAGTFHEMDPGQERVYGLSTMEMQRQSSTFVPPASVGLKDETHFITKQDASEASVKHLLACSSRFMDSGVEKLAAVSGVNNWCNFSTSSQPVSLRSIESDIQYPPYGPICNKQPMLRFGGIETNKCSALEHETYSQTQTNPNLPKKCSCPVYSVSLSENCACVGKAPVDTSRGHVGRSSSTAPTQVPSILDNIHMIPEDKANAIDRCENFRRKSLMLNDCQASRWRDVPSKQKGFCNAPCIDRPAEVSNVRRNVDDQPIETAAMRLDEIQEAESLNEQQMSNVFSGCSAPAVTEVTGEVNNVGSCTIDAEDVKYVNDHVFDEGSGIAKCWSSDETYDSERSTETVNDSANSDIAKVGFSSDLPAFSSRSPVSDIRPGSMRLKVPNRSPAGCAVYKSIDCKQLESDLRKRKKPIKWKRLDASFHASGLSSVHYDSPISHGQDEPHLSSSGGKKISSSLKHGLQITCGISSNGHSNHKRKRSALNSAKTLSRKRDQHELHGHHGDWENYSQKQLKDEMLFCRKSTLLGEKKLKWCCNTDVRRQFPQKETNQASAGKATKDDSARSVQHLNFSFNQMGTCDRQPRPVVCGNSGIISNGKSIEGRAKPKIVSLSSILKKARSCSVTEHEEPIPSSISETKKSCLKSEDSYTVLKSDMDPETFLFEKKKECISRNEVCLAELSMLPKDSDGGCPKLSKEDSLQRFSGAPFKSKFKETRKRSLDELSGKRSKLSSTRFCLRKSLKCSFRTRHRFHGQSCLSKRTDDNQCHTGELCEGITKKSIKTHKCQAFIIDSDAFCCVCGSSNKDDINCLLQCSGCSIRVHQACYGVSKVPKGRWYCRPCRTNSKNIVCVLCGYGGGAMTRALKSLNIVKSFLKAWNIADHCSSAVLKKGWNKQTDVLKSSSSLPINSEVHNSITAGVLDPTIKQWVHMVCGLWTPGTRCPNVDTMSAFDVSGASSPPKYVVCSMCNQFGGSYIQCRVLNCTVHFHPWCAHQKGLLQSEVEGVDNEKVGFYGRCMLHATHNAYDLDNDPVETKFDVGKEEFSCARTEDYKGRKKDGFRHIHYGRSNDNGGCLVPQEQINAWLHINGQKSSARGLQKPQASDIEYDCRKEYARYKQAKGWKHLVVYKSGIHALGLYTSRFIPRGAMVVEYVGEIVGLRVADKREIEYQSGRKLQYKSACYFFRIDKEHIIDATRKGGIARFVNHSCLPNCVAKVISVRNEKKVVFFAERDINPGEEITYDYHFNHEDEGKKIPCFCNSKNCRRYLN